MDRIAISRNLILLYILVLCILFMSGCGSTVQEEKVAVAFSSDSKEHDDVFVDVVSIQPKYTISINGGRAMSYLACECEITSGAIVWVYISTDKYVELFDAEADFTIAAIARFNKKIFTPDVRIYGTVREADDFKNDLSKYIDSKLLIKFDSLEE